MRTNRWVGALLGLALLVPALANTSGLAPGERTPAYDPKHIAGPDKGSTICPV